jgi:hypothetical protein
MRRTSNREISFRQDHSAAFPRDDGHSGEDAHDFDGLSLRESARGCERHRGDVEELIQA